MPYYGIMGPNSLMVVYVDPLGMLFRARIEEHFDGLRSFPPAADLLWTSG